MVPIFLAALMVARGVPALLYRPLLDRRRTVTAGLMQATSLPFIVAATAIGQDLELVTAAEGAALIGAGLLSVLIFPIARPLAAARSRRRLGHAARSRRGVRADDGDVTEVALATLLSRATRPA